MDPYYKARRDRYKSIHVLYKGSNLIIANIEYNLAIKFKSEWFTPDQFKEFINYFRESIRSGSLTDFS